MKMIKIDFGESILAPMAGITGFPFRKTALKYGADFCFTEMISALGFLHDDRRTLELTEAGSDVERTGIQLFGSTPDILARAAEKAVDRGFKVVDINMGCPVKKVVKTGAGSAILKDVNLFYLIVEAVRRAIKDSIFTIKIRSGFDESSVNFVEIAKIAESSGVDAIFFHPRARSLMFSGVADHSLTKVLKNTVSIPVYASGDVFSVADAVRIKEYTGTDGIMFARGAIGKPWIFTEYINAVKSGGMIQPIKNKQKIDIMIELTETVSSFYGKEKGCGIMKPHMYGFLKGFKGSKALRVMVNNARNEGEIINILKISIEEEPSGD